MSKLLTKDELIEQLNNNILPREYMPVYISNKGEGYKIFTRFSNLQDNIVCYIPEYGYIKNNEDTITITPEHIYTKQDILNICDNDKYKAVQLYENLEYEFPQDLYEDMFT